MASISNFSSLEKAINSNTQQESSNFYRDSILGFSEFSDQEAKKIFGGGDSRPPNW